MTATKEPKKKSRTLFEISGDMAALEELLFENEGDLDDPEAQKIICAFAEESSEAFSDKCDDYAALIKMTEALAKARREESARLAERAKVDENTVKSLKSHLHYVFAMRGMRKLKTARFAIGIAKNGGKNPLFIDPDCVDALPDDCKRIEVKPDSDAIRAYLDVGLEVPGCELKDRGESIRIR